MACRGPLHGPLPLPPWRQTRCPLPVALNVVASDAIASDAVAVGAGTESVVALSGAAEGAVGAVNSIEVAFGIVA